MYSVIYKIKTKLLWKDYQNFTQIYSMNKKIFQCVFKFTWSIIFGLWNLIWAQNSDSINENNICAYYYYLVCFEHIFDKTHADEIMIYSVISVWILCKRFSATLMWINLFFQNSFFNISKFLKGYICHNLWSKFRKLTDTKIFWFA